jgi:hypothetical protein
MADIPPRGQLEDIRRELSSINTRLMDTIFQLRETLTQSKRFEEDLRDIRATVTALHQLLQSGDPSLLTRLFMLEDKLEKLEAGQLRNRDWWLKLAASLTAAAILGMAGLMLLLYAGTKVPLPKP